MAGPIRRISGTNNIVRAVTRQAESGIVTSFAAAMGHASKQMNDQLSATVQEFGRALSADKLRRRLGPANVQLAEGARQAMASAYESRQNVRENNNYRVGKGYNQRKTGMLGPALANPSMIAATSERQISFVNTEFLRSEAPHWARLNFGVGPNAGDGPQEYTLQVTGGGMAPTALVTIGASRTSQGTMSMPDGVWLVPGSIDPAMKGARGVIGKSGDDWLRPKKGAKATIPTRGIASSNFVDAGFQYLGENVLNRYWDEFLEQAQSARSTLKVRRVDAGATFTIK